MRVIIINISELPYPVMLADTVTRDSRLVPV